MKITVSCKTCGKILTIAEKDQVSDDDLDMYMANSRCDQDGPFPPVYSYPDEGDPILVTPGVENTIIATKTAN